MQAAAPRAVIRKNKALAAVLAIFLGPVIWVYTYNQDKRKFWVGIALLILSTIILIGVLVAALLSAPSDVPDELTAADIPQALEGAGSSFIYALLAILAAVFGVFVWAFVDRLAKPSAWYENYPRAPASKTMAVIFAVFFSQLTWLYTYERDSTKFWIGFAASIATSLVSNGNVPGLDVLALLASTGIWIWAIVDTAVKDSAWYADYPEDRFRIPPAGR